MIRRSRFDNPTFLASNKYGRVVASWLTTVLQEQPDHTVWSVLDDDMRLSFAQHFVFKTTGATDDERAAALAARQSDDPGFSTLFAELVSLWRTQLAPFSAGFNAPEPVMALGSSMAVFFVRATPARDDVDDADRWTGQLFITRYAGDDGTAIAAIGRHLPVPGWPPGLWTPPQLRESRDST